MTSLILSTTTRLLQPLLLLYSLFLLVSGHDEPGGGFAGGLVAAAAFTLYAIAHDVAAARRALRFEPSTLIAVGLLLTLATGVLPLLWGKPLLTSGWMELRPWGLGPLDVGTPMLFDLGVYLVVTGVALTFVLSLAEE
ncbi:Na+/H+ antiporter subunit B [Archangium sp.]|uniref:Na+/H+ antiporter subunit B n=1 Tax=Archangium sp. TaxID=1872627 RepID=UPI002D25B0FD|nr:Na+/H+ antiporter subunit B [Archangium sp.]HYO53882.1 Na+/H+ antiporter subunit B [Archangium sp.]